MARRDLGAINWKLITPSNINVNCTLVGSALLLAGHSPARLHDYTFADCVGPTTMAQRSTEVPCARIRVQLRQLVGGNRHHPALSHLHHLHGPGREYRIIAFYL